MSHKTGYTHTLNKKSRLADRTQLDRLRCTNSQQALGDTDWLEESERYLDNVKALQSLYRKRSQSGGVGQEARE